MESSQEFGSERELPEAVLHAILLKCDFRDVGRSACVDRRWHLVASDDSLWKSLCEKHLQLLQPADHHGKPCSSYKEALKQWHLNFKTYPLSLVSRVKKCWDCLRKWTASNCPEIARSLGPGVSEEELSKFEEALGWKLPLAARLLYRFCGGQDNKPRIYDEDDSDENEAVNGDYGGLLGGYSFYHHTIDVHFMSLQQVLRLTQHFIPLWGGLKADKKWVVVAASSSPHKFFLLDCHTGSLFVGTRNLAAYGELMSCIPPAPDMQDSMLCWLEMYSSRLHSGMYTVQRSDGYDNISLYPELDPLCSEAVSNGVEVRTSAVFVPEYSTKLDNDTNYDNYMFAYSVRMRLLASEADSSVTNVYNSCQLLRRHWVIREGGAFKDEVRGPGVIGQYPLLKRGGRTFTYASCSPLTTFPDGSIEGDITFVPGSIARPAGPQFLVKVAEFPLEVPSFIY